MCLVRLQVVKLSNYVCTMLESLQLSTLTTRRQMGKTAYMCFINIYLPSYSITDTSILSNSQPVSAILFRTVLLIAIATNIVTVLSKNNLILE